MQAQAQPKDWENPFVLGINKLPYHATLQLPSKQKEVLMAICKEGNAANLTSSSFLQRSHLIASTVQAAVKGLLEKDFINHDMGIYALYDKFFAQWLMQQ
jgi:hypothetical protein